MADTKTVEQRHDAAMERIAKALGTTNVDLTGEARGDPALARAITMENIANAIDKGKTGINLRAAVKAAKDEDLRALPGVGEKSLSALREWSMTSSPSAGTGTPEPGTTDEATEGRGGATTTRGQ
jgi:DNA uptake protein ComE-like DNA-binding protein